MQVIGMGLCLGFASVGLAQSHVCSEIPDCSRIGKEASALANSEAREDWQKALPKFRSLYKDYQDPRLLFSIARLHSRLNNCESAVPYYRQFLDSGIQIDQNTRNRAEEGVQACPKPVRSPSPKPPIRDGTETKNKIQNSHPILEVIAPREPRVPTAGPTPGSIKKQPIPSTLPTSVVNPNPTDAPVPGPVVPQNPILLPTLDPQPTDLNHAPRPLWRLTLGGIAVGSGFLMASFGISGLAVNGQCSQIPSEGEICNGSYSTVGVGGGLLGAGLTLAAGGIVLLAVPGRQARTAEGVRPGNGSATGSAK